MELSTTASAPLFDQCLFTGGFNAWTAIKAGDARAIFIQCLIADNPTDRGLEYSAGGVRIILNCTITDNTAVSVEPGTILNIYNSILDYIEFRGGGTVTTTRCLYKGATGNNIDGVPTFVDAAGGNYRLAARSLGIDAAN